MPPEIWELIVGTSKPGASGWTIKPKGTLTFCLQLTEHGSFPRVLRTNMGEALHFSISCKSSCETPP
jgi:hypothetical protein